MANEFNLEFAKYIEDELPENYDRNLCSLFHHPTSIGTYSSPTTISLPNTVFQFDTDFDLSDPKLRKECIETSYEIASEFLWSTNARKTFEFLVETIKNSQKP